MKIIKENIENLDRVKGLTPVENPVMADAQQYSEKKSKETDELMNPLELKKKKPFIGAEKQETPKEPEEAKATLEESLFEEYVPTAKAELYNILETGAVDAEELANRLIDFMTEDDAEEILAIINSYFDESLNEGYSNQELIDAVQDAYGYNKTQALKYIKTLSDDAKKELVQGFKNNAKKSFLTDSLNESSDLPLWRGVKDVYYIWNGSWSDPELEYDGYTFNYWDIEDALWQNFLEDTGHVDSDSDDPEVEEEFNEYLKGTAVPYLEDVIAGGYFQNGSKHWTGKDVDESLNEDKLSNYSNKKSDLDKQNEKTVFDKVYRELSPDHTGNYKKNTAFKDVGMDKRYSGDLTEIDNDGNIVVYGKDEDALSFAKQVADKFNCETSVMKSANYKVKQNPNYAYKMTIKVEE